MFPRLALYALGLLLVASSSLARPNYSPAPSNPVKFEIELTWADFAPDGFTRKTILMNGQFPGPALEVDEGDDVEFIVHNNMPFSVTIHFHGIEQLNTPWSDGAAGVSQRPIEAGDSFLYKWNANQYGTYWYHAHERSLLSDGLYGAITIRPKADEPSAFGMISNDQAEIAAMLKAENNPIPLMVSDWSHFTSEDFDNIEIASGIDDFCIDSILINGKGSEVCPGQDVINGLVNPLLKQLLNGTSLTAKGYVNYNMVNALVDADCG
jgi:FtsP/CotA-like multicopper oxidase with cupredoxin domain